MEWLNLQKYKTKLDNSKCWQSDGGQDFSDIINIYNIYTSSALEKIVAVSTVLKQG